MLPKLLAAGIAIATTLAAAPVLGQSLNGSQAIEEIQITSTSRRSVGLADVNASVSVLSQDDLYLI